MLLFLYIILRLSFVQTFITHKIAAYFSKELKTEITIGGVDISWFLNVILEDVSVKDRHKNVLMQSSKMTIDIGDIYTKKRLISIDKISMDNTTIGLRKYKNEKNLNFQFIVDYFSSKDTTKSTSPGWNYKCYSLVLSNSHFIYQDFNSEFTDKGMDFNNLDFSNFNINISDIQMMGDSTYISMDHFSFLERSGFVVKNMCGDFLITSQKIIGKRMRINTNRTILTLNMKLDYKSFDDFSDFFEKVNLSALLEPSRVDLKDLCYFAPDLNGLDDIINVSGELKGKLGNLKGKNFRLLYGRDTRFSGNFNFSGLPNIDETYINLTVRFLSTSKRDIEAFNLPGLKYENHLSIPPEVAKLGNVRFNGVFTGFVNDFVAAGDFYTDLGKISTDLSLKNKSNIISYNGKIGTENFKMGEFLANREMYGNISMNADINGSGIDAQTVNAKLSGTISAIDLNKYNYKNITIEGNVAKKKFSGSLNIRDDNLNLDFNGTVDYSEKLPVFDFSSEIRKASLARLNLVKRDSLPTVSASLNCNFKGDNIDNIQGTLEIKNALYRQGSSECSLHQLKLTNTSNDEGFKSLDIHSDFADVFFSGKFMFKDIANSFSVFLNDYLPSFGFKKNIVSDKVPDENFTYKIDFKETKNLTKIFVPALHIAPNTSLNGFYNSIASSLVIMGHSPSIRYQGYEVKNWYIKGKTENSVIIMNSGCERFALTDSTWLDNLDLNTTSRNDSILFDLFWRNKAETIKNSGDIAGFASFTNKPKIDIRLFKSDIVLNDSVWSFGAMNLIEIDTAGIALYNINLKCNNQKLSISGFISDNPKDFLTVQFYDFNISDLDFLTQEQNFDMDGIVNGTLKLSNLYSTPSFSTDLTLFNFGFNHEKVGDAVVSSYWDNFTDGVRMDAKINYKGNKGISTPVMATGYYYPDRKADNFDFDIKLDYFQLKFLTHYFTAFTSDFSGIGWGNLQLKGTPADPELSGSMKLAVKHFKIDYLNSVYSFSTDVKIKKDAFIIDHLVLYDVYGDTAIVKGKINHKNFSDFHYNFDIVTNKFLFLNTDASQNNLYYGKAMMSAIVKIVGDESNVDMDVTAKTLKDTKCYIPISNTSELSESNFISFVNRDSGRAQSNYSADLSGIKLDFDLDITPDAEVQIIFDSKVGDVIKAKGNANFNFQISSNGDFNMYGDYVIEQGDYLFTLQNVINKKFEVVRGGTIRWNGDPYNADVNLQAIYGVRAPLFDLVMDSSAVYKKRIKVDCILGMTDKLMNPVITFNIDLPNSDESTKMLVSKFINTEQDMNRQVFSLLMLNRFMPPSAGGANLGSTVGSTSSELLSNQLSNWLSQISKDFDIGVKYRPGDEVSSNEVEVALSTQLFNDRVSIDGNLGVAGAAAGSQPAGQSSSNIVGDVNVEVKLTDEGKFRIKAYNKSNNTDLLNSNSPYTQGVGILYRKEFDNLKGLLQGSKASKKIKKNKK